MDKATKLETLVDRIELVRMRFVASGVYRDYAEVCRSWPTRGIPIRA